MRNVPLGVIGCAAPLGRHLDLALRSNRDAREYEDFYRDRGDAAWVLAAYPHDYVMLDPVSPAMKLMKAAPGWKLIYRDDNSLLYARSSSPAAALPGIPVNGTAPPSRFR